MLISGNVAHVDKHVDMMKGEHKSSEILKINPNGTLPILVADGKVLLESAACLKLLASSYPTLKYLYPDDGFGDYNIDSILDYCGSSLSPTIATSMKIYIEALRNK
jgi:glutathione S-transferase